MSRNMTFTSEKAFNAYSLLDSYKNNSSPCCLVILDWIF